MSDGRCETCKWWDRSRETQDPTESPCLLTETDARGKPLYMTSSAVAEAVHAGPAILRTTPDFGCVQWVKRADAR